jgi:hypothetical protein
MAQDAGAFVIVEPGAAQGLVAELEAEGFDKVELGPGVGAEADDVAGVGRNFGLVEDDCDHGLRCGI